MAASRCNSRHPADLVCRILVLLTLWALSCGRAWPEEASAPVTSEPAAGPPLLHVIEPARKNGLDALHKALRVTLEPEWALNFETPSTIDQLAPEDVLIVVGASTLQDVLGRLQEAPPRKILCLFIPASQFQTIVREQAGNHRVSALYADAPLERQIRLAKALRPGTTRIGVLSYRRANLEEARQQVGTDYHLTNYPLIEAESLAYLLSDAIEPSGALVGIYHPELFNNLTIKPLLLSIYRQSRFLVGPNEAFVKAGSLGTTYSTLYDTARNLSEILATYRQQRRLPDPDYGRHFSVMLNEQVGRSLGLILPTIQQLQNQLVEQESARE